jgi:hypothetical protein
VVIVTPLVITTVETGMLVVTVVLPDEETREAVERTDKAEREDCPDNTESEESDATEARDCDLRDTMSVEDVVVDPELRVEESPAGEEVEEIVLDGELLVDVVLSGVVSDEG